MSSKGQAVSRRIGPGIALLLAAGLAACAEEAAAPPVATLANGDICVDIPEGYYAYERTPDQFTPVTFIEGQTYRFENGALILVRSDAPGAPSIDTEAITSRLTGQFAGLGFPWLGLDLRGKVATLTGTAPSQTAKEEAFAAGEAAIRGDAEASRLVTLVVDAIAVEGGGEAVGAALLGLGDNPDLNACQTAFVRTMEGRNIEFRTGGWDIDPVSARLLDALTGVAMRCTGSGEIEIEIGGHTDKRGGEAANLELSKNRADAVKAYLVARGVDGDVITTVGYGASQPLDPADTLEAYEKNRRTQFTLRRK